MVCASVYCYIKAESWNQNKTKQNKTKQNKTKRNETKQNLFLAPYWHGIHIIYSTSPLIILILSIYSSTDSQIKPFKEM